jgi:hypothetical protein
MRCRYCFDIISDRTQRCPHCGSLQPVEEGKSFLIQESGERPRRPMRRGQLFRAVVFILIVVTFVAGSLAALLRPSLLPPPIIAALNLGTPLPTSTPQVTRAVFATATPPVWQNETNQNAGFSIRFPANWIIVNQAQSGWRDRVRDLGETYGWAETLFETGRRPAAPQSRAVDPNAIDTDTGQLAVFTIGPAAALGDDPTYPDVEQIARNEPEVLSELAGPLIGTDFTARRSEFTTVAGRRALLVEFTAQTTIFEEAVQVRVRMYFVLIEEKMYLISYFAEEQLANSNRGLYEDIVRGFEPISDSN